jgi:hypothetical protein
VISTDSATHWRALIRHITNTHTKHSNTSRNAFFNCFTTPLSNTQKSERQSRKSKKKETYEDKRLKWNKQEGKELSNEIEKRKITKKVKETEKPYS